MQLLKVISLVAILLGLASSSSAECIDYVDMTWAGDPVPNFNNAAKLSPSNNLKEGLDLIDKITEIKVYKGFYFPDSVVTRLETTYRLKDGSTKTITSGGGGNYVGTFVLGEGVYLKRMDIKTVAYVEWVEFYDTNGRSSGKLGGGGNFDGVKECDTIRCQDPVLRKNNCPNWPYKCVPNRLIPHPTAQKYEYDDPDTVIQSFVGSSGAVIDVLWAYLKRDTKLNCPNGQRQVGCKCEKVVPPQYFIEYEIKDFKFTTPNSFDMKTVGNAGWGTLDNSCGNSKVSDTTGFEYSVENKQSLTISKSFTNSRTVGVKVGFKVSIEKIFDLGSDTSFTYQSQWGETSSQTLGNSTKTTFKKGITANANPGCCVKYNYLTRVSTEPQTIRYSAVVFATLYRNNDKTIGEKVTNVVELQNIAQTLFEGYNAKVEDTFIVYSVEGDYEGNYISGASTEFITCDSPRCPGLCPENPKMNASKDASTCQEELCQ